MTDPILWFKFVGNDTKVPHLWNLQGAKERLRLVKAELTEDGSFDNAIMGCDGVFYMASPVFGQPTQVCLYAHTSCF